MEQLQSFFSNAGLSHAETEQVVALFREQHLGKGELFAQEGRTSRLLGFIDVGLLQYFINVEGKEKTTYTVGANMLVASLASFLKQVPAKESIRALIPTTVWVIDHQQLRGLIESMPAFKTFYIGLLEWQISCIDESRLDAITLSAQERYIKMLQREPEVIQQVPLQYLASILGVTPRHLSRIRGAIR